MTETLEQKVARRQTCYCCKRRFRSIHDRKQHEWSFKIRRAKANHPYEQSEAEIFIEAEMNRAAGIPNEDWIEDMLP